MSERRTSKSLLAEIEGLRQRLTDAEETLRAITSGEVDALVVNTKLGERIFTLEGADTVYRAAIENINEGIITLSQEGTIIYSNRYFAQLLRIDLNKVIGAYIFDFVSPESRDIVVSLLQEESSHREVSLRSVDGSCVSADIATRMLKLDNLFFCAVVHDITERKKAEKELVTLTERLRVLSHRLIEIQEEERTNIARELHDQIGQSLNFIKLLIDRAKITNKKDRDNLYSQAGPMLSDLIERVSTLSLDLRPKILDDLGLVRALEWYFDRFTTQTNIRTQFKPSGIDKYLRAQITNSVYRVVQEALTNVARHAKATKVTIKLKVEHSNINLRIEDNGIGFDPAAIDTSLSGGIIGMQERTGLLGGTLQVQSKPGAGTRIVVKIPYR